MIRRKSVITILHLSLFKHWTGDILFQLHTLSLQLATDDAIIYLTDWHAENPHKVHRKNFNAELCKTFLCRLRVSQFIIRQGACCLIFISLIYKVFPVYKASTTILRIPPPLSTGRESPLSNDGTYSEMLKSPAQKFGRNKQKPSF